MFCLFTAARIADIGVTNIVLFTSEWPLRCSLSTWVNCKCITTGEIPRTRFRSRTGLAYALMTCSVITYRTTSTRIRALVPYIGFFLDPSRLCYLPVFIFSISSQKLADQAHGYPIWERCNKSDRGSYKG